MFTIASSLCRMGVEPLDIKNRNTWTKILSPLGNSSIESGRDRIWLIVVASKEPTSKVVATCCIILVLGKRQ